MGGTDRREVSSRAAVIYLREKSRGSLGLWFSVFSKLGFTMLKAVDTRFPGYRMPGDQNSMELACLQTSLQSQASHVQFAFSQ